MYLIVIIGFITSALILKQFNKKIKVIKGQNKVNDNVLKINPFGHKFIRACRWPFLVKMYFYAKYLQKIVNFVLIL